MSEEVTVEEPQANPYNAKKVEAQPRGLLSADDSLAFKAPAQAATPNEEMEDEPEKYKKVNYKKRYDDLKRHYDAKVEEGKAKERELQKQLEIATAYKVPKTPEELATFREQYPDVYDVVESVAFKKAQEQLDKVNQEIERINGQLGEAKYREAQLLLEKRHPDYKSIIESDDFSDWAEAQPDVIKGWVFDNPDNADLASRALDLFKRDTGYSDKQSKPRTTQSRGDAANAVTLREAGNPSTGEKRIWTTSEIAALSIKDFEKFEPELQAAHREGRIRKG